MAAPLRAIRSSAPLRAVAAALGAAVIWISDRTVRWRIEGAENRARIRVRPRALASRHPGTAAF